MPIYEFRCLSCEHRFEELVASEHASVDNCPKCKGKKIVKELSSFAVKVPQGNSHQPGPQCGGCPGSRAGGCPFSSGND